MLNVRCRTRHGVNLEEIEKVLDFVIEIEKLKDVHRKTRPVGLDRYENSAEHSWHVCLCALMLKDYANEKIDIDRVIRKKKCFQLIVESKRVLKKYGNLLSLNYMKQFQGEF